MSEGFLCGNIWDYCWETFLVPEVLLLRAERQTHQEEVREPQVSR